MAGIQDKVYLYGSSRLGDITPIRPTTTDHFWRTRGNKQYELSNHLGNVLATVSDRKMPRDTTADGRIDYYLPEVRSGQDYYAFGQSMPSRSFNQNTAAYRFGFNGKENDTEWFKQDYGFRIYDQGIGRFLSVDPLTKSYSELTPYQFASNRPIDGIDLDGLEFLTFHKSIFEFKNGAALIKKEYVESEQIMSFTNAQGQQFMGTNRIVGLYKLEPTYWDDSNEFNLDPSYDPTPSTSPISDWKESSAPGRRNNNSETPLKPTGQWDARQTRRLAEWTNTSAANPPTGSAPIARGFLAKEMFELGKMAYNNFKDFKFLDAYRNQERYIDQTIRALEKATKNNLIPEKQRNSADLFEIADFVLQGNRDIKAKNLEIGIRITQEITNNYRAPFEGLNQTRGMDNVKINIPVFNTSEFKKK